MRNAELRGALPGGGMALIFVLAVGKGREGGELVAGWIRWALGEGENR